MNDVYYSTLPVTGSLTSIDDDLIEYVERVCKAQVMEEVLGAGWQHFVVTQDDWSYEPGFGVSTYNFRVAVAEHKEDLP